MLPSDMNLDIKLGIVGYNNKILLSDGMFSLGKMIRLILQSKKADKPKISHKVVVQPTITHKDLAQK